jgi:hypothetical protein
VKKLMFNNRKNHRGTYKRSGIVKIKSTEEVKSMDLSMIQQLLTIVGDALPKYLQGLEEEFAKENGELSEEQRKVFEFVQKKAKEFITQMNPLG